MSKIDDKQREAINRLSRLSATRTTSHGIAWVDTDKAELEEARITELVESGLITKDPVSSDEKGFDILSIILIAIAICVFGYGFYGIAIALINV